MPVFSVGLTGAKRIGAKKKARQKRERYDDRRCHGDGPAVKDEHDECSEVERLAANDQYPVRDATPECS
jgi:hypothetical protein